jgi:hypothetical protein
MTFWWRAGVGTAILMLLGGDSTVLGAATTQINGQPNQCTAVGRDELEDILFSRLFATHHHMSHLTSLLYFWHTENVVDPTRINPDSNILYYCHELSTVLRKVLLI